MKTVKFEGKSKFEIDEMIRDWKSAHPSVAFMNPPLDIRMPATGKGKPASAEKTMATEFISVCFEYRE